MDIRHLKEFVSLAETLSYNKTADAFFISKSALSKHIKAITAELGIPLFVKRGTSVELTQAGRVFYVECAEVLNAWDDALVHVKDAADEMFATINIGCPSAVIRDLTDELVDYLDNKHPEIRAMVTEIRPRDVSSALRSGLLDALIGIDLDINSASYDKTHLFDDRFYAVVSNDHPLAKKDGILREDLEGYRLLLPSSENIFGSKEFLSRFIPGSMQLSACRRYQSFDALLLWVINGNYVGFSAGYKMNRYADDVRFLPITDADTSMSVDVYWTQNVSAATRSSLEDAFERVASSFIRQS